MRLLHIREIVSMYTNFLEKTTFTAVFHPLVFIFFWHIPNKLSREAHQGKDRLVKVLGESQTIIQLVKVCRNVNTINIY